VVIFTFYLGEVNTKTSASYGLANSATASVSVQQNKTFYLRIIIKLQSS